MTNDCGQCGAPIPAQTGRGGRRRYCLTCSPPRPSTKRATLTGATVTTLPTPPAGVYEATLRELKAAELVETVGGQLLLLLARAMSDPAQTASGVASAAKVFAELFDKAVTQVKPREDELTKLRRQYRAKFAPKGGPA